MKRPFEVSEDHLRTHLEELVSVTIADLGAEFLLLPKGDSFIEYADFRDAYEVLKRVTGGFKDFTTKSASSALAENSRVFGVMRAMLGMTPPE